MVRPMAGLPPETLTAVICNNDAKTINALETANIAFETRI